MQQPVGAGFCRTLWQARSQALTVDTAIYYHVRHMHALWAILAGNALRDRPQTGLGCREGPAPAQRRRSASEQKAAAASRKQTRQCYTRKQEAGVSAASPRGLEQASITYSGSWLTTTDPGYYNDTTHYTNTPGDYTQYTFSGTSVAFYGGKANDHGKVDAYIDGVLDTSAIEMYAATRVRSALLYTKTGLSNGSHTIKIVLRSDKNASSSNNYFDPDYFDYTS